MCVERVAVEEGNGGVFRFVDDVDAEVGLEDEGDERGEVGVANEEPIGVVGVAGGVLSESHFEEVLPEFSLYRNGGVVAVRVVGVF